LLAKLKEVAEQKKLVQSISVETICFILEEARVTYQHTKVWNRSNAPDFVVKKRIRQNYSEMPKNGRVICIDEFGPRSICELESPGINDKSKKIIISRLNSYTKVG
jgi:hypothetical protein